MQKWQMKLFIVLVLILKSLNVWGGTDQLETMVEAKSEAEVLILKGIHEFNAQRMNSADRYFDQAIEKEKTNILAHEYKAGVHEYRGAFEEALKEFALAKKFAFEQNNSHKVAFYNFQMGRLFIQQGNFLKAEIYLKQSYQQGLDTTSLHYLLGYNLFLLEKYKESEVHLLRAYLNIKSAEATVAERSLEQAVSFYLGEVYVRLGYSEYAVGLLRNAEFGESNEIRSAAWKTHASLRPSVFILRSDLGTMVQRGLTIKPLFFENPLWVGFEKNKSSFRPSLSFGILGHNSIVEKIYWGIECYLILDKQIRQENNLYGQNKIYFLPYLRYWNQQDFLVEARVLTALQFKDRASLERYQTALGMQFEGKFFKNKRTLNRAVVRVLKHRYSEAFSNQFYNPTGSQYGFKIESKMIGPNPVFKPGFYFEYEILNPNSFLENSKIGTFKLFSELDLHRFWMFDLTAGMSFLKNTIAVDSYYSWLPQFSFGITREVLKTLHLRLGIDHTISLSKTGFGQVSSTNAVATVNAVF